MTDAIGFRNFSLLPPFFDKIEIELQALGASYSRPRELADAVLRLSDFYIQNPSGSTPWRERFTQLAYLSYYLPLNYVRAMAVLGEASRVGFPSEYGQIVEWGSGLGSLSLALEQSGYFSNKFWYFLEQAHEATLLHQKLVVTSDSKHWVFQERQLPEVSKALGLFSYVYTELSEIPDVWFSYDSLIFVEPSTQEDSQRLILLREKFLQKGYYVWAPCTHQAACPMQGGKRDWCHDRVSWEMPSQFSAIESFLPMKNSSVSLSYLLLSRVAPSQQGDWRVVGDLLKEKGKSRQMVCHGPEREFLAWMHKNGDAQEISRGALLEPLTSFEKKSNEIRVTETLREKSKN